MSKAKRKCLFFVVFILCCVIFFGCSEKESEAMNKKTEPEGRLTRIEYSQTNGMVYGDDFSVDVIPEQVLYTRFFSTTEYEYVDKENIPIDSEQWHELEEAVLAIFPVLEERHFEKEWKPFSGTVDGGGTFSFYLTWENEGKEERISYHSPNDRRFTTLFTLLEEIANPIGREIVYYDAPELNGFFISRGDSHSGKASDFSYQCTVKNEEKWYFFSYFGKDGVPSSLSTYVGEDIWKEIAEKCAELDLESAKDGSSKDKTYAVLYYSDGKQRTIKPDKKTVKELQIFFEELVSRLEE